MSMKMSEWIEYVKKSRGIDTDGAYGFQCMDLYNNFCNNVLELQNVGADCAKNILNNKTIMDNVEKIYNYPDFIPNRGDIAVWTGSRYGHCAICLGEGDLSKFKSIDQNWQFQQLTEEWHSYDFMGPIVFLRPKNQKNIKENKKSINEMAKEVISGKYGNGDDRKNALKRLGYTDIEIKNIQNKVNEIYNNQTQIVSNIKSLDEIAREVIRGDYGNGEERIKALKKLGYTDIDINNIQNRVNELMK